MKLYFSPGTCSLSPHIALLEAELSFELVRVDMATRTLPDGTDFLTLHPRGYVPLLQLPDGRTLVEGPAILQFIADQCPTKRLAPPQDSFERNKLQEWLGFINTELHHKLFAPLFDATANQAYKDRARQRLVDKMTWLDQVLSQQAHLLGNDFSVADIYLHVVLGWQRYIALDLTPWPALLAFQSRVGARPSVRKALRTEMQLEMLAKRQVTLASKG